MKLSVKAGSLETEKADLIVVALFEGEKKLPSSAAAVDKAVGGLIGEVVASGDFGGKLNQALLLPVAGTKLSAKRVLLLGLGKSADFKLDRMRQAAAKSATAVRDLGIKSFATEIPGLASSDLDPEQAARAFAEGAFLGTYRFSRYRTVDKDKEKNLDSITVVVGKELSAAAKRGVDAGAKVAEAVAFARNLVSAPPNEVTPTEMGNRATQMGKNHGVKVRVLDEKQIRALGMGSFLGVAQGSLKDEPPRFIIMEYLPQGANEAPLVFIGKGITFDSGGISIKPSEGMEKMKYDMAGAAAVIGAVKAIASLELPVNVVGLVPATENMPGGDAIHPGDVLTSMSGKTIEVINTDAEGRLILADALTYAERYKPKAVVDLATLTGACVIALGNHAIGMMGNNEDLQDRIRQAGETTNERVWPLPLWDEYHEQIKSDIADIKNTGGRPAGTITAAAFLAKFAEKFPWVHLDIAGTAWDEKGRAYVPKGATGIGVRLLLELAQSYAKAGSKPAKAPAAKTPAAAKASTAAKKR